MIEFPTNQNNVLNNVTDDVGCRVKPSSAMGKPSSASKRAKRLAKKKGLKVSGNVVRPEEDQDYSIDDVLDKASSLMDEYNYELAQKFCQRALEIDADNVRALEVTASLLLESGQELNVQVRNTCFSTTY